MARASLALAALALAAAAAAARFGVEDDAFGGEGQAVRLKVLRNLATGERAEVAWNAGGRTEALRLVSPATGKLRDVLLHSRRNATDVWANVGWKGDMLIPYANGIRNGTYELAGRTHHLERNEDRAPYGEEALHGYLYRKVMNVTAVHADDEAASVSLSYDFDGTDPGYPFLLSVVLTYALDKNGLSITTRAHNRGSDGYPLPFFNSWHSYFVVSDISRSVVTLDRCSSWNHVRVTGDDNVRSDLIPTGVTAPFDGFRGAAPVGGTKAIPNYWDDEFKATASTRQCPSLRHRVYDPALGDTSVLWGDAAFRWVQIFTGTMHAFGEQAIAVEAMSGQCDAWNNLQGMRLLQSGEVWEASFGVSLESGPGKMRADEGSSVLLV